MLIANMSMSITVVSGVEQQQGADDREGADDEGQQRGDQAAEDEEGEEQQERQGVQLDPLQVVLGVVVSS